MQLLFPILGSLLLPSGRFTNPSKLRATRQMSVDSEQISFHILGDAYVDFFCFLDSGGWPEIGGDSRLEEPLKSYAGGSSTNTATHLQAMLRNFWKNEKGQVLLHTVLNPNDHYGKILIEHATNHDFPIINCHASDKDLSTGHCVAIVSGGERSFMTHQGCVGNFGADDIQWDSIMSTPGDVHLHIAGFYNIPGFWDGRIENKIIEFRKKRKELFPNTSTTVSLVTQHDATRQWDGQFCSLLAVLDFAIMNDLEARNIVKKKQGDEAPSSADEISSWASFFGSYSRETVVVVTRGELGAVAFRNGEIIADQPTVAIEPVDPTGAGDSFTAGFIHGIWDWKRSHAEASTSTWPIESIVDGLRWGCALGRAAILLRGASIPPEPNLVESFRKSLENGL